MIERRPVPLRLAPLLVLVLACNTAPEPTDEGRVVVQDSGEPPRDRPPLFNPDPSPPAPAQLVPPLGGPSVGMQPGYLDGAVMFASIRAGALQDYGQSIPFTPNDARELAELGQLLGADPRVDDVLAFLGVDPNSRTSLSIRPILDHASAVKQAIDDASPILDELHRPSAPDQPTPPPLSADAELLLDRVESLGVHVRWHIPIVDASRGAALLEKLKAEGSGEWATTCATLPANILCTGDGSGAGVLRQLPGALQLDAVVFFSAAHDEADTELRRALIQQAVALPAASSIPGVGSLRGDANLLIAGTPTVNVLRTSAMADAIRDLGWTGRSALADYRNHDEALLAFHEPERVFDGIKIEANVAPQRVHFSFAWLPTPLGKQKSAAMFELLQVDADVPALAGLCEGSLLCARTRGLPSPARFESLAAGPFASPEAFEAMWDKGDDEQLMLLLALESWPNMLGMLAKFPGQAMEGPEAMVAENMKKAADRALAFGVAIRKLDVVGGKMTSEWASFARMPAMDLATLRGLMRMGELGLAPATLDGVPGSIESAPLPDDELPGRFYAITDPEVATGSWGWAVAADGDERARWLLSQPRDDGAAPIAYFEIRDLWGLIGGVDELAREYGHAQAWLSGRSMRAQWDNAKDGPEVRMVIEKLSPP